MKIFYLVLSSLFIVSCNNNNPKTIDTTVDQELESLYALMQGSFNSKKQALQDSTYYNISLHMYPIWQDRGHYLYVEQALNSIQNKPYRQRIYELKRVSESTISSAVYTLPNDSLYIGKYDTPEAFNKLTIDSLELREGCSVILQKISENVYKGSTGENTCTSSLRGASYATSEVSISSDKIESWDRGFDEKGNHIWGAERGGYVFDKVQN